MSSPYSPYGPQGGGPYGGAPNAGQYGAPSAGSYGAPGDGGYGQPAADQYGQPQGAPYGPQGGYAQQGYAPQGYGAQGYAPQGYGPQGGYGAQGYGAQRGYLQGGPVDFQSAIKLQIANVTSFQGRASLSAYWWYALALLIVDVVLVIFSVAIGSVALSLLVDLVLFVAGLSALSLAVRRLHDTDKSGWMLLLGLIPFVGGIIVLVFMLLPGTPNPNRFG